METFDGHQVVCPWNEIWISSFYKVKYFKEGTEEKRHLKYNTFPQDESFSVSVHDTADFDAALTNIFSKVNFKFL